MRPTTAAFGYEKARLANIKRNEAELKRLGLHLNRLTAPATGRQAPTRESRKSRAVPPRSRWSARLWARTSLTTGRSAKLTCPLPVSGNERPRLELLGSRRQEIQAGGVLFQACRK